MRRFFSNLQIGTSHLAFSLEKKSFKIPFTWLRDHCPCPLCIQPSTKQKTIHHISPTIQPLFVSTINNTLKIQWKNHTSVYHQDLFCDAAPLAPSKFYWTAQHEPLIQSYTHFIKNPKSMIKQLHTHGLAFIKNIPKTQQELETLASHFGIIKDTFYGRTWDVKSIKNAKNIAYTNVYLGFHMDLMYFDSPPGLQLLLCLENDAKGGHSIFMDSFKAIKMMEQEHPESLKVLEKVPIRYEYDNDGHHLMCQRPLVVRDVHNDRLSVFYAPPFQGKQPLHSLTQEYYQAIHVFETIINDPSMIYKTRLNAGDMVIFDNRRVLHGREHFDPASGNRHLKGTYVCGDSFLDKVHCL